MKAYEAIDRLVELEACYRAVAVLAMPNMDVSMVEREDLAMLMLVLNRLNEEALIDLQEAFNSSIKEV